jgi:hypothetical protein
MSFRFAKTHPYKHPMKTNLKNLSIYIITTILIFGGVAIAGSLTPTGSDISPTMVTLEDLYQKTQDFTYSTSSHNISTESTPSATMHTLSDIWTGLTNFILPPVDKVEDGYAYGPNGSLEGTLSAGAPVLEWSADLGAMTWASSTEACTTWGGRLPTISELLAALSDQFLLGSGSGFAEFTLYWSSTENGSGVAYNGNCVFGNVYLSSGNKNNVDSVRCVR